MADEGSRYADPADDDDCVLTEKDKPGFSRWTETLSSREKHKPADSCIGKWLPAERLVELVQQRGKKHATTGFVRGGAKLLHPEEALYLLDEGVLFLLPFKTRVPARSCEATTASGGPPSCSAPTAPEVSNVTQVDAACARAESTMTNDSGLVEMMRTSSSRPLEPLGGASLPLTVTTAEPLADPNSKPVGTGQPEIVGPDTGSSGSRVCESATAPSSNVSVDAARSESSRLLTSASSVLDAAAPQAPTSAKRKRNSDAVVDFLSFQQAYELLLRYTDPRCMLVYSLLRSQGLLPLRHRTFPGLGSSEGSDVATPSPRRLIFPVPHEEPALEPVYDVYARDGITSFKPSAPGAADFYVCISSSSDAPPTPSQISVLQWKLKLHSAAARRSQLAKIGERADLEFVTPAQPQIKIAIVAPPSTVTFYALTTTHLAPPT